MAVETMSQKIDGSKLAKTHALDLRKHLIKIRAHRPPSMVSFCNTDDDASIKYTRMKKDKAGEIGIFFQVEEYSKATSSQELADKIREYDFSPEFDGIMVQLPLPNDLVVIREDLKSLIAPEKDVDGLTDRGQEIYIPATAKGVMSIIDYLESVEDVNMVDQIAVILGSEGEVGRPMVRLLKERVAEVIGIDQKNGSPDYNLIKKSTIIVSCVGTSGLVVPEWMAPGAILIDIGLGTPHNPLGDFTNEAIQKSSFYTGKTGGVGPMTVISLMENVVESYERRYRRKYGFHG